MGDRWSRRGDTEMKSRMTGSFGAVPGSRKRKTCRSGGESGIQKTHKGMILKKTCRRGLSSLPIALNSCERPAWRASSVNAGGSRFERAVEIGSEPAVPTQHAAECRAKRGQVGLEPAPHPRVSIRWGGIGPGRLKGAANERAEGGVALFPKEVLGRPSSEQRFQADRRKLFAHSGPAPSASPSGIVSKSSIHRNSLLARFSPAPSCSRGAGLSKCRMARFPIAAGR